MDTAALSISLGLACPIQSRALFGVFYIYLVVILLRFRPSALRVVEGKTSPAARRPKGAGQWRS